MIVYNMRYRGPLEYDKFVLNTLQFHNEINGVILKEFESETSTNSIASLTTDLDKPYTSFIGVERSEALEQAEKIGFSKDLYLFLLEYREV